MKQATWRSDLREIYDPLDAAGKKAFCLTVGVSRIALQRWRNGENSPDAEHLRALIAAIPDDRRAHFYQLILEDPKLRGLLSSDNVRIPQRVYEQALRASQAPAHRFWTLSEIIVREALGQLGKVELTVARCMPPREEGKVRSLRTLLEQGTEEPWRGALQSEDYFLGAESLAGAAVMQRRGIMIPNLPEACIRIPPHEGLPAVAYPIMYQKNVAGALMIAGSETDFFTQELLLLIEQYADLIRLAFYDEEFISSSDIELGMMPSREEQKRYFSWFRDRAEYKGRGRIRSLTELVQLERGLLDLVDASVEGIREPL